MKTKNFIWLCLALILAQSCSKEDSIAGAYRITQVNLDCPGTQDDLDLIDGNNDIAGITLVMDGSINFTASGNYTMAMTLEVPLLGTSESFSDNGTYEFDGINLTTCSFNSPCESAMISLSSGNLRMSSNDGSCELDLTAQRI